MKIMKKIAVAVFAGAMVFGLASCGAGDDDPNNMINGSNKVYTIDYTNESKDVSRGYNTTATNTLVLPFSLILKMRQTLLKVALWVLFLTLKKKMAQRVLM